MKKTEYYFRYVVTGQIEKEFTTLRESKIFAKKNNEKIYLTVYLYSNKYNEPYDEILITGSTNIKESKSKLIQVVLKYAHA